MHECSETKHTWSMGFQIHYVRPDSQQLSSFPADHCSLHHSTDQNVYVNKMKALDAGDKRMCILKI